MKEIKFPYYSGNIFKPEVLGHVAINRFIKSHENPTKRTLSIIKQVQEAKEAKDEKLKRQLKQQLYAFTPSVYIPKGLTRRYENVYEWTGIMQLDFDKIPDMKMAIEIKEYIFEKNKEIICAYISPSGTGVKALMKTKIPEDKAHYKALHKAMVSKFEEIGYLDLATNNAMLPLFLSIDYDILYRDYKSCYTWNDEDWNQPRYVRLLDELKHPPNFNLTEYEELTITILEKKINNIVDNGHPQVRSAALVLGSRVGAGYLNVVTAQNVIDNLIKNNGYLQKGYSGYLATALWGISEGSKNPKYYDK
jgi:hypothetical protein